jgi:adenine phosphoribosyltransferase
MSSTRLDTLREALDTLREAVRDVPDFPSPGIVFKDITPMLSDGALFKLTIDALVETVAGSGVTKIVGIDARGFIFAAAVADRLGCGFVPVRKKGKLPWKTEGVAYDLEYGSNEIEIHADAVLPGERVWLVDDVLATGGTAAAAAGLVQRLGGVLAGMTFLIELGFLDGRKLLPDGVDVAGVLIY